ncbi:MAG TPA: type VI secretion system-associated protein TagO [SAR86 cluster bacterium]|nr:type VI secretion system-associated protein TagO [SAR86 cluster bacterium]HJM15283.1 type VI secretion system-associated protein TagO [SAR86 cluster bacterium]
MIPYTMRYLFLILLFSSSLIFSNDKQSYECADIEDNSSRLDCYDSLFRNQTTEDPLLIKKPKETKTVKEIKVKESKEKEAERRFGLPLRSAKDKDKEKMRITDKIVKVKKLADLRLDVTLENGQRWRSVEKIRQVRLKPNQEITISEGFVSGYVLKVIDKKISIRVRRIK